jgi:PAS domain S-box-containing protein
MNIRDKTKEELIQAIEELQIKYDSLKTVYENNFIVQKNSEEILKENERKLREAQEMAHLGYWNLDVKTGEVKWSEEVFKIFRLDPKEFSPQIDSILALSPWPEDHQRDLEIINRATESHNPGSYEQKFIRPDNSIGYYYSTFQGKYDKNGTLISIIGTVLDITEHKLAEEKIRASEEKYKQLFDNTSDHIFILDVTDEQRFKVLAVNPVQEKLVGALRPGFYIEECLSDEIVRIVIQNYRRCLSEQKIFSYEEHLFGCDFQTQLIPVKDSNDKVYRIIGIARNITNEKKLTNQLIRQNEESKELNNELIAAREILRESEAKFRNLFEHSPVGKSISEHDGYLDVNKAFCDIVGYSEEELKSMSWQDITYEEDIAITNETLRSLLDGTRPFAQYEKRYVHKNGNIVWALVSDYLQRTTNGEPDFFITNITDITLRKYNEDRIRILSLAIEQNPVCIIITDPEGLIEYVNPRFTQTTGYSSDEVIGQNPRIFNTGVRPKEEYRHMWETIVAGDEWHGSFQNFKKDGATYYVTAVISPILDEEKRITHYLGVMEDITKQVQAENQIRTLSKAIEQSPSSIIITNAEGEIEFVNNKFKSFMQYTLDDVIGKKPRIFNEGHLPGETFDFMWETLRSGNIWQGEYQNRKKGQVNFWEHVIISPLIQEDGLISNFILIMEDITEQRQNQEEIKKLNSELEQRVVERTEELETINRELEAFSYSVSHDLRAPLRAIDGFTSILVEDYESKFDDEGKKLCTRIKENTQQMGHLIDDLLSFSRLGRRDITMSKINMKGLASSVYKELTTPEMRRKIDFHLGKLDHISGDRVLLHQVWYNLIANAIKFSSRCERIEIAISCYRDKNRIVYCVKDHGAGFDMKYSDKLFGVFQRLHSVKEFEGTGVGLAIVQRIINRHGGEVWAEGEVGKGAAFYFALKQNETDKNETG